MRKIKTMHREGAKLALRTQTAVVEGLVNSQEARGAVL